MSCLNWRLSNDWLVPLSAQHADQSTLLMERLRPRRPSIFMCPMAGSKVLSRWIVAFKVRVMPRALRSAVGSEAPRQGVVSVTLSKAAVLCLSSLDIDAMPT